MTDEERKRHLANRQAEYRRRRKLDPVRDAEHRRKEVDRVDRWRRDNPEKSRPINAKSSRVNLAKKRKFLAEEKMKSGCVDCGYNSHPAALDFDHIGDDKLFTVSQCTSIGLDRIKKEIKKCVVRCSNCHRIITHRRLCDKMGLHDALQPVADHFNPPHQTGVVSSLP